MSFSNWLAVDVLHKKYSQKSVCILSKFVDCDFATVWRNKKQTGHGILMYGLLRAMADERV